MRGRRLFLILAISIAAYPSPPVSPWAYVESDPTAAQDEALNGHVIWLYDPSTNLCLGSDGFSTCGDTNLFRVRSLQHELSPADNLQMALGDAENIFFPVEVLKPLEPESKRSSMASVSTSSIASVSTRGNHYIHLESVIPSNILSSEQKDDKTCMGRSRIGQEISSQMCSRGMLSTTRWEYNAIEGRLSTAYGRCVFKQDSNSVLKSCSKGHTVLRPIFHTQKPSPDTTISSVDSRENSRDSSSNKYVCPHTGLQFPSHLRDKGNEHQSLLAKGVYTKQAFGFLFKVFSIAWYIDKGTASTDPTLIDIREIPSEERSISEEFYHALVSPVALYDRSVMVKMAMDVKKDMLIDGLLQDMHLRPETAVLLAEAGRMLKNPVCERGLEILFTWRSASTTRPESFDIRVNGKPVTSITEPGVGEDFFSKFVTDEPVSSVLKQQLSASFDVFQSDSFKIAMDVSDRGDEVLALGVFPVKTLLAECTSITNALLCFERIRAKRPSLVEEAIMSLLVLVYCCVLISQSLPSKSRPFRGVRLRERLSSLSSSLKLSTNSFAKKCSIPSALNLIAVNSVSCPRLASSR